MGRHRDRGGVALGAVILWGLLSGPLDAHCRVPGDHADLQRALEDSGCRTIETEAGTYTGNWTLTRPVTLQGAGPGTTALQAATDAKPVLRIALGDGTSAEPVRITGVTIRGGGSELLQGGGITATGDGSLRLTNVALASNQGGMMIRDHITADVAEATIQDNDGPGILARDESDLRLRETRVAENRDDAVRLEDQAQADIRGSILFKNQGEGVYVSTQTADETIRIVDNAIQRNWWDGVMVAGPVRTLIKGNEIQRNGLMGVVSGSSSRTEIVENRIAENGTHGLNLVGQSETTVRATTITANIEAGITLEGEAQADLVANRITANRGCGVESRSDTIQATGNGNRMEANNADICGTVPPGLRAPTVEAPHERPTATVPTDFGTLQAAVDAVEPGGHVEVQSGSYTQSLTLDKPITIQGNGHVRMEGRTSKATILSVVATVDGQATLRGLTIRGGRIGIAVTQGVSLEIADTLVTRNELGLSATTASRIRLREGADVAGNFQGQFKIGKETDITRVGSDPDSDEGD